MFRFLCCDFSFWHWTTIPSACGDPHRGAGTCLRAARPPLAPVVYDPKVGLFYLDLDPVVDSGKTSTAANDVWRRPLASMGEMRTSLWNADSA